MIITLQNDVSQQNKTKTFISIQIQNCIRMGITSFSFEVVNADLMVENGVLPVTRLGFFFEIIQHAHLTLVAKESRPSRVTSSQAFSCCSVTVVWYTTCYTAVVFAVISVCTQWTFYKFD